MGFNTELVLIVDESGSMNVVRQATVSGIDELVQKQTQLPGDVAVTLATFDTTVSVLHERVQAGNLRGIPYFPGGMTALYDAIVEVLGVVMKWTSPPDTTKICAVLTDGQDNASNATKAQAMQAIKDARDAGWEVLVLGSGAAVMEDVADMGFTLTQAVDLSSAQGTQQAYRNLSQTVFDYRVQV